jgi:hypothetical protein
MGLRLRLRAGYSLAGFHGEALIALEALERYGLIVVDNGSPWSITGAPAHAAPKHLIAGPMMRSCLDLGASDAASRTSALRPDESVCAGPTHSAGLDDFRASAPTAPTRLQCADKAIVSPPSAHAPGRRPKRLH